MHNRRPVPRGGHMAHAGRCEASSGSVGRAPGEARPAAVVVLLCVAIVLAPVAAARGQSLIIRHSPPLHAVAGEPVGLEAALAHDISPERIAAADVVVVTQDGGQRSIPLTLSRNSLFGEVPGVLVTPPGFSYYLRVVDTNGIVVTAPTGAPEGGLFEVRVEAREDSIPGREPGPGPGVEDPRMLTESELPADWAWTPGAAEALSPLPGEIVQEDTPQIAALFDPPLDEPWDALVLLDGVDVTGLSEVTSDLFLLVPVDPLATGPHRVTFSAVTATGAVETSWVFFVHERTADGEPPEDWLRPVGPAGSPGTAVTDWENEAAWQPSDAAWQVSGRLEAGWAVVAAETTAVESVDIFLPYSEVNRPSVDFYLSGVRGTGTFLMTARYDPVYSDELDYFYSFQVREGSLQLELRGNRTDLVPYVSDRFGWGRRELTFLRDDNGAVSGFTLDAGNVRNLKFRRVESRVPR